ncbi:ABC transporter ATP-binding protein [Marinimicrobium sp. ARAG 43.8]|uniref:ABC transporter ATP-binding protein n=1 Tax=Marinimicrobium sp. ARAG 43.8 TaxID=3418719 RepID=UPI003CEA7BE6
MSKDHSWVIRAEDAGLTYKSRVWGFKNFQYNALRNMNFEVRKGETLGIMGRNGCGKSSLLRMLAGVIDPTEGVMRYKKQTSRMLLTLGLGFDGNLSGRDNAILSAMLQGFTKAQARGAVEEIKTFSELGSFFDQPVKVYSSGMKGRLGFSTALKTDVDVLLIDEVLSVGDAHFKHKAEKAMMEKIDSGQTVVFVSHSGGQVDKVCDRAIWLEKGEIKLSGDTKSVAKEYKAFMNELNRKGDAA